MTPLPETAGPLRCLSVQQPFAWAICAGVKTVENRTWGTDHRGLIAIHAGAARRRVNEFAREAGGGTLNTGLFTYGAVIGVAELVGVVEMDPALEENPNAVGPGCWLLRDARLLPSPVPRKGRLQLFPLTEAESEKVRRQLPGLRPAPPSGEGRRWEAALAGDRFGVYLGRGDSYLGFGRFDDAIRNYDLAAGLDPSCPELFAHRAWARLGGTRDHRRAVADCDRALALDPGYALAWVVRAEGWRLAGDEARAGEDERRAEELAPGIAAGWRNLLGQGGGEDGEP